MCSTLLFLIFNTWQLAGLFGSLGQRVRAISWGKEVKPVEDLLSTKSNTIFLWTSLRSVLQRYRGANSQHISFYLVDLEIVGLEERYCKPHQVLTPLAAAVQMSFLTRANKYSLWQLVCSLWSGTRFLCPKTWRTPEAVGKDLDHLLSKRTTHWSSIQKTCR